jgi:hypothetical protein
MISPRCMAATVGHMPSDAAQHTHAMNVPPGAGGGLPAEASTTQTQHNDAPHLALGLPPLPCTYRAAGGVHITQPRHVTASSTHEDPGQVHPAMQWWVLCTRCWRRSPQGCGHHAPPVHLASPRSHSHHSKPPTPAHQTLQATSRSFQLANQHSAPAQNPSQTQPEFVSQS